MKQRCAARRLECKRGVYRALIRIVCIFYRVQVQVTSFLPFPLSYLAFWVLFFPFLLSYILSLVPTPAFLAISIWHDKNRYDHPEG